MIFNHSEKDYQDLQKTNWKNIEYLNGKIEKLEKENAKLIENKDGISTILKIKQIAKEILGKGEATSQK